QTASLLSCTGMPSPVTIVGGGLAGLTAAISCAEQGAEATVLEAHRELGGRARSCDGPFVANLGPHALYRGRQNWAWLAERKLLPPTAKPPVSGVRYRYRGRTPRLPPAAPWRVPQLPRPSAAVGPASRGRPAP